MTHTLTMFNTGQVTLPKVWRSKQHTKKFIALETSEGLLIKPLRTTSDDIVYYESKDGFGLYSDGGIDPEQIILAIETMQQHG